ncbi:hypothetical protein [Geobacter sp.]|uniref:hypothetical protein n=1 Tax=Geobacter sp. TaxID=46610 RepID=UPI00260DAFA6|nr:hypothetical protein [Geobacter sp.]
MDKLAIINALNKSGICALITGDEIRLYLILLAAAAENGHGVLPHHVIQRALGATLPAGRLILACLRLQELGLIELEHRTPHNRNEISYRIRQPARGKGRGPNNRGGDRHDESDQE